MNRGGLDPPLYFLVFIRTMLKLLKRVFKLKKKTTRYQLTFYLFDNDNAMTFVLREKDNYGNLGVEQKYKFVTLPKSTHLNKDDHFLTNDVKVIQRFMRLFRKRNEKFRGRLSLNLKIKNGSFEDLLSPKLPNKLKLILGYARSPYTPNLQTYVIELKD